MIVDRLSKRAKIKSRTWRDFEGGEEREEERGGCRVGGELGIKGEEEERKTTSRRLVC